MSSRYSSKKRSGSYSSYSGYKKKRYSSTVSRARNQIKAAKKGNDSLSFVINSNHVFSAKYNPNGEQGVACVNIWEVLARNSNFNLMKQMYDQIRIDAIQYRLNITNAQTTIANINEVNNYTIYTAWDKTGLSPSQYVVYTADGNGGWKELHTTDFGKSPAGLWRTSIGKGIVNNSSAKKSILSSFQRWNSYGSIYPHLLNEKSQYVQTSDIELFSFEYNQKKECYELQERYTDETMNDILASPNPVIPFESTSCRFKPCLLVGVFSNQVNEENITPYGPVPGAVVFNGEFSISCTFRNLKGTSREDTPSDDSSPSQVVLNRPLDISLNVEKTLTFNHNDLNNQTTLKYSGYLPVTFRYQRPRFLRAWYDEQESLNDGTYTHSNLPINKNGKYKIIPNDNQNPEGYILARPIDQTGNDYDVQIDIPSNPTDPPSNAIIVRLTNADVNVAKDNPDDEGYIKIPGNFWDHVIQDVEIQNQDFFNSLYINVNDINLPRDNSITLRLRNQDIINANSEHNPNRGVITIPNNQLWQDLIQHIDIPEQGFYSFIEIMVGDLNVWDPNLYQLKANQVLNQNGTYEVYDEDPDQENGIEILSDNRSRNTNKIIKFKATRDGENEEEEEEEPNETKTNYLGKFTVNVPQPTITQISNYEISNVGSFNIPIPSGYDAVDSISGNVDVNSKLLNSYTFEPSSLPSTFNIQDYNQANNTEYIGVKEITCSDTNLQSKIVISYVKIEDESITFVQSVDVAQSYFIPANTNDSYLVLFMDDDFYYITLIYNNSNNQRALSNFTSYEMRVYKFGGTRTSKIIELRDSDYGPISFIKADITGITDPTSTDILKNQWILNCKLNKNYYDLNPA